MIRSGTGRRECSQARGDPVHSAPLLLPLPQPNFGFVRVADIPQVHIPEIHRLSIRRSSVSGLSVAGPPVSVSGHSIAGLSVPDDSFRVLSTVTSGVNYQFLSGSQIPQVQLPDNWNAPLQNPIPVVPPIPVLSIRGRGRLPIGPFHNLSGGQSNPA